MPQIYARSRTGGRHPLLEPRKRRAPPPHEMENINSESDSEHSTNPSYAFPGRRRDHEARAITQPSDDSTDAHSVDDIGVHPEDGEDNDDSDDPAVFAPSCSFRQDETGRPFPSSASEKGAFEREMFSDDEDDSDDGDNQPHLFSYKQVDDVEDDDDEFDEGNVFLEDEQFLEATNDWENFLNHVDGLSEYGFDDGDAGTLHTSSSPEVEAFPSPTTRRHVHFQAEMPGFSIDLTPTMAPALLPSALPDSNNPAHVFQGIQADISQTDFSSLNATTSADFQGKESDLQDDSYDSDATVESLPPEAHTTSLTSLNQAAKALDNLDHTPSKVRKRKKKSRRKMPARGFFDIDTDKPYAIVNNARLEVFVPCSGSNRPAWLSKELLPSEDGSVASGGNVSPSGLIAETASSQSSDRASVERRMADLKSPSPSQDLDLDFNYTGTVGMGQGLEDLPYLDFDLLEEADLPIPLSSFITFDDGDSDDDSDISTAAGLPEEYDSSAFNLATSNYLQINAANVTSFRRSADPSNAAHADHPITPAALRVLIPDIHGGQTPPQGHKRKASDSPYASPVYHGVVPVHRVIRESKRRRMVA